MHESSALNLISLLDYKPALPKYNINNICTAESLCNRKKKGFINSSHNVGSGVFVGG
jgi:hypothetical protein